jgi:hypothetical protein
MRDVWASSFLSHSQGLVQVVFSSSTTRPLGAVVVATEWFFDGASGRIRSDPEIAEALEAWFAT